MRKKRKKNNIRGNQTFCRHPLFALLFAIGAVCCQFLSQAYATEAARIPELTLEKIGTAKTLLVFQKSLVYPEYGEGPPVLSEETLRYVFPKTFRSDAFSANQQRIQVVRQGEAVTIIDGKTGAAPANRFDAYKDLLLYRSPQLLREKLSGLGIDLSVSSLGLFNEQVAFVLGAEYPDISRSQLWTDKKSFLPFRLMLVEHQENVLEIRWLEWRKHENIQYPMRIEFYQNHRLIRETAVSSIEVNPLFSDDFFDIEKLKAAYPAPETAESHESDKYDEVREIIEDFRKVYE
jgi:hypothetical protein